MKPGVGIAVVATLLQLVLVLVMLSTIIGKIAWDGFLSFAQHYTNWSWTFQMIFYAATLPAYLVVALEHTGPWFEFQTKFIALFFVPLWSIVVAVMLLVITMLLTGAEFMEQVLEEVPLSVVILGNEMFHFVTVLILFLWAVANQRLAYFSLNDVFAQPAVHRSRVVFWALVAHEMILAAMTTMFVYLAIFDPQAVYSTKLNFVLGFYLLSVFFLLASSLLLAFIYFWYLGQSPIEYRWIDESEFEARGERVTVSYAKLVVSKSGFVY